MALPGASVSSGCGGAISISHSDNIIDWICTNRFTLLRTYTAMDNCGSEPESCVQTILVNDILPPVFITCPPTVIVEFAEDIPAPVIVSYTDCSGTGFIDPAVAPPGVFWEEVYGLGSEPGYCPDSIYRFYVALDACYNTDTCLQKIFITGDTTCATCEDDVEFWPVDLTAEPPFEVIIVNIDRFGLCCDYTSPRKCVAFDLMLHPDAVSLSIDIRQGTSPWQSASITAGDWRLNCDSIEFTDNNVCLSGDDFFTITHCKPGDNTVDYRFTSIPGAIAEGPPITRIDCPVYFSVSNITDPVWNSIYPGSFGMYNSYLSCTNCFTPTFTPTLPIPEPPQVTYEVCGELIDNNCQDGLDCDEVTIGIFPAITLGCDGQTFYFCEEGLPSEWQIPIDVSPMAIYRISISSPDGSTNIFVNENNFFYNPPSSTSGTYSVFIEDLEHDYGCDSGYFAFYVQFLDCMICPDPDTICPDEFITLNNLSDFTALGGALNFPCEMNASSFTVDSTSDGQSCPEIIAYTIGMSDNCGNTATCGFDIVKDDNDPPVWITPAGSLNQTVDCDDAAGLAAAQALFPVATDNCDDNVSDIIKVSGAFIPSPDCPTGGTYTNTWTVEDNCENISAEYLQTITVEPAPPAQFEGVAPLTIPCDEATMFTPGNLGYSNNSSGGCLIEGEVMGVLTGTFDECGGTLVQNWTFTDECNRTCTQEQIITVLPALQAQFESAPLQTITCEEANNITPDSLEYTNDGLGGCLIEGAAMGVITGTFEECGGTLTQTWTFTDNCGRTSMQTQTITVEPAPQAQFESIDSLIISCDEATTFSPGNLDYTNNGLGGCLIEGATMGVVTGTFDECGGMLTQTWTFTDNCGRTSIQTQTITVEPAPQAQFESVDSLTISCDEATTFSPGNLGYTNNGLGGCLIEGEMMGVITGSYDECDGTLTQTWTFTDNCGRTSIQTQTITVEPAPQAQFESVDSLTITCNEATIISPSNLGYSNNSLGGCLIEGEVMGVITGSYDECGGELTQDWTFTDDCGRTCTQTQVITVEPALQAQFAGIAPLTISCDQATTYAPVNLGYTNNGLGGCLIEGAVMGVITGSYDECGGELTQDWTFTDDCGRTCTQTQTITVESAPQAQFAIIAPVTITCDEATTYAPINLGYTNNGLGGCLIEGEVIGVITGTYDECGGTLTQDWTYTDDCGRTCTQSQAITVQSAPQAQFESVEPLTITCDEAATIIPDTLDYTNNGLGGCLIEGEMPGVIAGTFDECGGVLTQNWSFTDACGRTCTQTQSISVEPAPQAQFESVDSLIISCDEATSFTSSKLRYTNNGLGGCLIEGEVMGVITGSYDECDGELIQSWYFTDDCGRICTQSQVITVEAAPQAEFESVDSLTITCDEATIFAPSNLVYTNNGLGGCLIEGAVMGVISGSYEECGGELTQDWSFTDACGRTCTQTQTITVEPSPQAQFEGVDSLTITCNEATIFAPSNLRYTNNGLGGCLIEGEVMGIITGSFDECGGELTQDWSFTDACGRTCTQTQTITVEPSPQAQFASIAPVTITCDEATAFVTNNLGYTNNGLGGCLIEGVVMGVINGSYDECGGELTQEWTFTDNCGRTSTQAQIITVESAPQAQFESVDPMTITCDQAATYVPDTLGYTNNGLGGCLIEGAVMGVISSNFDECGGTLIQSWSFTDDCGRISSQTQINIVESAPQAQFESVEPLTITCDKAATILPDDLGYTNNGLGGCLIEGKVPGIITGTFDECGGVLTQNWSFTDACGRTCTQTQSISVESAPQAQFESVDSLITTCDEATSFTSVKLRYTNNGLGGCLIEGEVPGVITGTFDECGGELIQNWTFTDDCGRTSTQLQIITVEPSQQAKFESVDTLFITCAEATSFTSSNLKYTNNGLEGCLIEGEVPGVITGTFDECGGELTQEWTFTDDCGRISTQMQTIKVMPAPQAQFTGIAPLTITCDEAATFAPVNLGYTNNGLGGCLIEGAVIGVITGNSDECGGTLTQTWTFTDACGRTSTQTQTITVEPAQVAYWVNPPADTNISCEESANFEPQLLYYSNNQNAGCLIEGSVMGVISGNYDDCDGLLIQTWTFTDNCGRTIINSQNISIFDVIPPILIPPQIVVLCAAPVIPPYTSLQEFLNAGGTASDNCGVDENSFLLLSEQFIGEYPAAYSILRTYGLSDPCGNQGTCEQTIDVPALLQVDAGQPQIIPYGSATFISDATACGGSGTLIYSWTPADLLVDPTVLNPITVNLYTTTIFTLTVTDGNGCENSDYMTIFITGGPLGVNPTAVPPEICIGETSQLFANASGGSGVYTFTWTSDPPGFFSDEESPFVSPLVTTTYFVEVNDGINTATGSVVVVVHPLPVFECPQYGPVCEGSEVIFFIEPGIFKFEGIVITQFNPISAGNYAITYIETTAFGCSDSCVFVIVVNPLPEVFAGQDQIIPSGISTTIDDASASGNGILSYSWTPANLLVNPTVLHPSTVSLASTTTFILTVIDNNGCENSDDVIIHIEGGPLTIDPTAIPDEICIGETSQLFANATGGSGVYTFSWTSDPPGFFSDEENPLVNPFVTTTYFVEVSDGFTTKIDSVVVTVHPLPEFECPQYGPECAGNGVIIFTEPGMFKYQGEVVTQFIPDNPGSYHIIYIITSEHGCTDSCEFVIDVNPMPVVEAGSDQTIPFGSSTTLSDATVSGNSPFSLSWSPSGLLVNPTVLHPITANLYNSTEFILTVTDRNGCSSYDTVIIEVQGSAPTMLQAISGPGGDCQGNSATVALEVDNFTSVSSFQLKLKYNATCLLCEGYTNIHPQLADNLSAWIDQGANEITFQWQAESPVTFTQKETVAELVFTLKQSGIGQLDWFTGETESYFTNPSGSIIPAEFQSGTVIIYKPPEVILDDSIFICEGQILEILGFVNGINPPFDSYWTCPNGHMQSSNPVFSSVSLGDAGDYTLFATDKLGCTDQKSIFLVVYENPVVVISPTDTLELEPGEILDAGSGFAFYLWNNGESTQYIPAEEEGWFWVTVASEHGCIDTDSVYVVFIEEIEDVKLYIPNAFTPDGDGINDTFFVVPSNDNVTDFTMMIFNRWGAKLWETNDITEGWDGIYEGILCPGDAYVYKVIWKAEGIPGKEDERVATGMVILLQ